MTISLIWSVKQTCGALCLCQLNTHPSKLEWKAAFFLKTTATVCQDFTQDLFSERSQSTFQTGKIRRQEYWSERCHGQMAHIYTTQGVYAFKPFSLFCISFTVVLWNIPSCISLAFGCLAFFLSFFTVFLWTKPVFPLSINNETKKVSVYECSTFDPFALDFHRYVVIKENCPNLHNSSTISSSFSFENGAWSAWFSQRSSVWSFAPSNNLSAFHFPEWKRPVYECRAFHPSVLDCYRSAATKVEP